MNGRTSDEQQGMRVCARMWQERGDSAFHRQGRTADYVCIDRPGHSGPHTGRRIATVEGASTDVLGQREGSR